MNLSVSSVINPKIKDYTYNPINNKKNTPKIQTSSTVPFNFRSYVNFTGNAPEIKKASIITSSANDIELQKTENGGYIVESETQTELIYGKDAAAYLNKTNKFNYDTQITFPKKAEGKLFIDGKEVAKYAELFHIYELDKNMFNIY